MAGLPPLQALRSFAVVAREGTVSGAAARLHLSQPAVSLQLKNLEEITGLRLFNRTPQGLVLTADGAALLPEAEATIAAVTAFADTSQRLRGAGRQTLRVGTILDPEFIGLGRFLSHLLGAAPKLETQLRHGMSDDALAQVALRELDVGFYLDLPSKSGSSAPAVKDASGHYAKIRSRALRRFTYRVAAPTEWAPRVRRKGWKELAGLPWLATPLASAHRRLLHTVFKPLGVEPTYVAMTDQEPSLLHLLKSGVGLGLVRDEIAERERRDGHLVVADKVSIDCEMSFICLEARTEEYAISQALAAIEAAWPQ